METKTKILTADDEKSIKDFLRDLLTSRGFDVVRASNGKETLEAVKQERPDLVLLDINMPDMDGLQACEALKKDPDNASLPVLMLTAREDDSVIVQALKFGADDYLMKPIMIQELLDKIDDLLSKARSATLPSQNRP